MLFLVAHFVKEQVDAFPGATLLLDVAGPYAPLAASPAGARARVLFSVFFFSSQKYSRKMVFGVVSFVLYRSPGGWRCTSSGWRSWRAAARRSWSRSRAGTVSSPSSASYLGIPSGEFEKQDESREALERLRDLERPSNDKVRGGSVSRKTDASFPKERERDSCTGNSRGDLLDASYGVKNEGTRLE